MKYLLCTLVLLVAPCAFGHPIMDIHQAAVKVGLKPQLLLAVCMVESNLNPKVINEVDGKLGEDSYGLCQIQYPTAKSVGFRGRKTDLLNPAINARYAAKYLKKQLVRYDGDIQLAVSAYNLGTARYGVTGALLNRRYVDRVMKIYKVLIKPYREE